MSSQYQVHYITKSGFVSCGGVSDELYMATRNDAEVTCPYCKSKDADSDDKAIDKAFSIIRSDYYTSIKGIAADLRKQITSGDIEDREQADTWLHETVDGCYWVIYHHATRKVLMVSDNCDAYEDTGLNVDNNNKGLESMLSQIAYWAVMADLREELGDLDALFESEETDDEQESEETDDKCAHSDIYLSDKNTFVCRTCDEELGR